MHFINCSLDLEAGSSNLIKSIVASVTLIVLAGCGPQPSLKVSDGVCKETGEKLSRGEKIINAIDHVYRNRGGYKIPRDGYVQDAIDIALKRDGAEYSKKYAQKFFEEHPDCCLVEIPNPIAAVESAKKEGRYVDDGMYEAWMRDTKDFDWVNDIIIPDQNRPTQVFNKGTADEVVVDKFMFHTKIGVDSCGKARRTG